MLPATLVVLAARVVGFEGDRSFYLALLVFIALLYVLFGVQASTLPIIAAETAVALTFSGVAVLAYRRMSDLLLADRYAAHGIWDLFHPAPLPDSDAVALWWPAFCFGVDLATVGYLVARSRLARRSVRAWRLACCRVGGVTSGPGFRAVPEYGALQACESPPRAAQP